MTGSEVHDGEVLEDLLEQIPEGIKDGFGGAYDSKKTLSYLEKYRSMASIPPRKNAILTAKGAALRNEYIREIETET